MPLSLGPHTIGSVLVLPRSRPETGGPHNPFLPLRTRPAVGQFRAGGGRERFGEAPSRLVGLPACPILTAKGRRIRSLPGCRGLTAIVLSQSRKQAQCSATFWPVCPLPSRIRSALSTIPRSTMTESRSQGSLYRNCAAVLHAALESSVGGDRVPEIKTSATVKLDTATSCPSLRSDLGHLRPILDHPAGFRSRLEPLPSPSALNLQPPLVIPLRFLVAPPSPPPDTAAGRRLRRCTALNDHRTRAVAQDLHALPSDAFDGSPNEDPRGHCPPWLPRMCAPSPWCTLFHLPHLG